MDDEDGDNADTLDGEDGDDAAPDASAAADTSSFILPSDRPDLETVLFWANEPDDISDEPSPADEVASS